ncbi:MAG: precorrin-3B C(17)-methyltransferase [Thermodesulfobacteriota bacterium]|nr:precorrin-3B C(17)-methyltransferase [Thermodesulfobacteriota bacterium]
MDHLTPRARAAIDSSGVVVGYKTYLDLVRPLLVGKEVISSGMMQEKHRCTKAVEVASAGSYVSIVSGGDPGIYGMAGLVFEILSLRSGLQPCIELEVVPGVAAINASASRLGAPLMHDFASISLSDLLTPWEVIAKRLEAASSADFVIVLYNPKSKGRTQQIARARDTVLKYRDGNTPVGIVRNAARDDETITITTLNKMLQSLIDMQSTVIIGNTQTFQWGNFMITPRGYMVRDQKRETLELRDEGGDLTEVKDGI